MGCPIDEVAPGGRLGVMSSSTCDVLDRLEEAVLRRSSVRVTLQDGRTFVDDVREVVTENGHDYGVFSGAGKIDVKQMSNCERADETT